ncbi:MAG: carboxypeptidase regulatory-like domain-containing protein [Bdellovibrionota bacterium]
MSYKHFSVSMVAIGLMAFAACSGSPPPAAEKPAEAPAAAAPAEPAAVAVPAEKGSVEVTVNFSGAAPKMPKLAREADPVCAKVKMNSDEVIVNANNTLKNAVVHTNGSNVPGTYPAATSEVVLDQKECMYAPHVISVQAGQPVAIKNSDQTLHNVHSYKGAETLFNQAQPPGAPNVTKTFEDGSTLVKFTCDVHPWMTGYAYVAKNPFHGVTGDDGKVSLKDIPVGTYKIEVWHEKYGTQSVDVTVTANQTATAAVTFAAQ